MIWQDLSLKLILNRKNFEAVHPTTGIGPNTDLRSAALIIDAKADLVSCIGLHIGARNNFSPLSRHQAVDRNFKRVIVHKVSEIHLNSFTYGYFR